LFSPNFSVYLEIIYCLGHFQWGNMP